LEDSSGPIQLADSGERESCWLSQRPGDPLKERWAGLGAVVTKKGTCPALLSPYRDEIGSGVLRAQHTGSREGRIGERKKLPRAT
jgi:hypothetical protein